MPERFVFHPDALFEHEEAAEYYLKGVSTEVALRFVEEVEAAISAIVEEPERLRIAGAPDMRRFVLKEFPFVIYYTWEQEMELVTIQAIMHTARRPGYWNYRTE